MEFRMMPQYDKAIIQQVITLVKLKGISVKFNTYLMQIFA